MPKDMRPGTPGESAGRSARRRRLATALLAGALAWTAAGRAEETYVNAQLPWHPVVTGAQGKLLAWYEPDQGLGYDRVVRLAWDFIEHKVPRDTLHGTGLPIYLVNSVYDPQSLQGTYWQHNPAMVYAAFVDSLVGWYPYSGDREAVAVVRSMLDHQLAHGTTPADWEWPQVPFATSCGDSRDYGRCIEDMPHEFFGGIETDKVGELGTGYALFYEMTGERKYLDAAIHCADALARHVRPGDAEHTPWPFRLDARTGATLALEEYGGDVAGSLRLFEELMRIGAGDVVRYRKARDVALKWLIDYPLNHESAAWNKWVGFFEDIPLKTQDVNQLTPMSAAYYILSHDDPSEVDPKWMTHVGRLIDWVRITLGRGPFFGAQAIDEQSTPDARFGCCSRAGQGDHTARWAAVNALFFEKTGDGQAREDAFRSLNYATYFAGSDGRIACCGVDYGGVYWFSDGYADYIRHFLWAMGAIPQFAPAHQNHLLRSSSVVQSVTYGEKRIEYRTFAPDATEVLRLDFKPTQVTAGGIALGARSDARAAGFVLEPLRDGDWVVRVHHVGAGDVKIGAAP